MEPYLLAVVALSSVGAYLLGVHRLGRPPRRVAAALGRLLECVGIAVVFALVNLGAGAALVFGVRALTGRFLSVYILDDPSWYVLSLLQAVAWMLWREGGKGRP